MADDGPFQDKKQEVCLACACNVLASLRDAAVSCEMAPLSALLQQALEAAVKLQVDGGEKQCECEDGAEALFDNIMQEGEARQLLEFVSAIAMLDEDGRANLAEELESAQINNLFNKIH